MTCVRTLQDRQTPYRPDKRVTLRAAQISRFTSLFSLLLGVGAARVVHWPVRNLKLDSYPHLLHHCHIFKFALRKPRENTTFQRKEKKRFKGCIVLWIYWCTSAFPIEHAIMGFKWNVLKCILSDVSHYNRYILVSLRPCGQSDYWCTILCSGWACPVLVI